MIVVLWLFCFLQGNVYSLCHTVPTVSVTLCLVSVTPCLQSLSHYLVSVTSCLQSVSMLINHFDGEINHALAPQHLGALLRGAAINRMGSQFDQCFNDPDYSPKTSRPWSTSSLRGFQQTGFLMVSRPCSTSSQCGCQQTEF